MSCDIRLRVISQEMLMNLIRNMCSEITLIELHHTPSGQWVEVKNIKGSVIKHGGEIPQMGGDLCSKLIGIGESWAYSIYTIEYT